MTYDPQIPLVTKSPNDSASPIQVNFSQFAAIFSNLAGGVTYNHLPFNNTQQGKHGAVLFQNQSADPGITGDLAVLYAKNATSNTSTEPQLFAQIPKFLPTDNDTTNAENTPMQLTFNSVNIAGPVYYSFLPGGYIFYFGNVTTNNDIEQITLAPIPTELLVMIATPNTVESSSPNRPIKISVNKISNSIFNVYTTFAGSRSFNWFAIGRA